MSAICECCKDSSEELLAIGVEGVACLNLCFTCETKLRDAVMFDEMLVERRLALRELRARAAKAAEGTSPGSTKQVMDAERDLYVAVQAWCAEQWIGDFNAEEATDEHEIQDRIEGAGYS